MNKQAILDSCDIDLIYDEMGWEPDLSVGDEDKGHCLDPWGLHKNGDRTGKLAINRTKKVVNCITGDTMISTKEGPRFAKDLSGSVEILTEGGEYRLAEWNTYGKRQIWEIKLENGESLFATEDHRWRVSRKRGEPWNKRTWVLTTQLMDRRIPVQHATSFQYNETEYLSGCLHGFVYGDGSLYTNKKWTYVTGWGEEDREIIRRIAPMYSECLNKGRSYTRGRKCPSHCKDLPDINKSASYLRGFIAGLIAADGYVPTNASPLIHQADLNALRQIKRIAAGVGIPSSSIKIERKTNPWNGKDAPLWRLTLVRAGFISNNSIDEKLIIKPSHRLNASKWNLERQNTHTVKVVEVKETERYEEVFCCVEPETQTMVIEGYLTGQCWVCSGHTLPDYLKAVKGWTDEETWNFLSKISKDDFNSDHYADRLKEKLTKDLLTSTAKAPTMPYFSDIAWDNDMYAENYDDPWFKERYISKNVASYFQCRFTFIPTKGVVLPHRWNGDLVGWQIRWIGESDGLPKYSNTKDFPRDRTVWGYNFAKSQSDQPIIVESIPTALRLLSIGWPSIATFGSQVTDEQIRLLRIFQQGVILAPDNDAPGEKWEEKLTKGLQRFIPVLHVPPVEKEGGDLGDLDSSTLLEHLKRTSNR